MTNRTRTTPGRAQQVDIARSTYPFSTRSQRLLGILGVVVVASVLPLTLSSFRIFQLTQVFIYAIALLGLNILTGYNGQVSLGHNAFYALGAYTTAIMIDRWNIFYLWTIPVAGVLSLMVGVLLGIPAVRLAAFPLALALATFALGLATPQLLKYFEGWTGGSQGIVLSKPDAPFGLDLSPDQWMYFVTLSITIVLFVLGWNLVHGRTGRAIIAIRDNPLAAEVVGINTALYRALTFGVSAAYTGIAGALGALLIAFVAPDTFDMRVAIALLVGIVIGGLASVSGAMFGAFFIQMVPNWAQNISRAVTWAVYGACLIGFMYAMPHGIAGGLRLLCARMTGRTGRSVEPW